MGYERDVPENRQHRDDTHKFGLYMPSGWAACSDSFTDAYAAGASERRW